MNSNYLLEGRGFPLFLQKNSPQIITESFKTIYFAIN